ncbi:hypothetical protein GCM10022380_80260 [Amycolatopsis tucumanensis]|uniref:Uncharacterized protein n=1 Tax=Amycolatopsis tucumanensis TaxID=401106 RepID=A0ABP7JP00_9PSEU
MAAGTPHEWRCGSVWVAVALRRWRLVLLEETAGAVLGGGGVAGCCRAIGQWWRGGGRLCPVVGGGAAWLRAVAPRGVRPGECEAAGAPPEGTGRPGVSC